MNNIIKKEMPFRLLIVFMLPIVFWKFYWYVGFNERTTKLILFITSIFLLIVFFKDIFTKKIGIDGSYDKYIRYYIIIMLISIVNSLIYWGQNPVLTFRADAGSFVLLYYFVLKRLHIEKHEIEKLTYIFAGIYIVLWLIAISQAPNVVFGNLEDVNYSRSFYRISQLYSLDMVCLLYFYLLAKSKYINTIPILSRIIHYIILIVLFIIISLSLFRTVIISLILVTTYFLLKKKKTILILSLIIIIASWSYISKNEIYISLYELTQTDIIEKRESSLRLNEYKYALKSYPIRLGTLLLGNGAAHPESDYGIREGRLKYFENFHRSDAGYVGIFVSYGIAGIILLLAIFIKVIKQNVSAQNMPYKLFIIFLMINNLTSNVIYIYGISFMISLYALEMDQINNKVQYKTKK